MSKTRESIANVYPDFYQAARRPGEIPDTEKSRCAKSLQIFFPRKWLSIILSKLIVLSCCDDALTSSNEHPVYKILSFFISI